MFAGIVEHQGQVIRKQPRGGQIRFGFRILGKKGKLRLGESIAVNGVCLTVAQVKPGGFEADVIRETLKATTLGGLESKDRVNLERSLRTGDRVGGHFVTGHVDAKGRIQKIQKIGKNTLITIEAPPVVTRLLAKKGSIAVDGISLTIQKLKGKSFQIGLIPHTLAVTTLGRKKAGDSVNLEVDLITRYLHALSPLLRKK